MTPVKPTSRIPRAGSVLRRRDVLDAALACFCEAGVEGTTIAAIQRRAQCSVGSLYHHFGSKEGLAEVLFLQGISAFNAGMLRRVRRCRGARQSVHGVVGFYCDWSVRNRQMAHYLHARDIDFSEDAKATLKQMRYEYMVQVFTWFRPFVEAGEIKRLPIEAYVPLISGPIQDYVRRWLAGHAPSPVKVKALFADAAWLAVAESG